MDPPDVLGMDSGIARPTKLPNRAKSKVGISLFFSVFGENLSVMYNHHYQNKRRPALRSLQSC